MLRRGGAAAGTLRMLSEGNSAQRKRHLQKETLVNSLAEPGSSEDVHSAPKEKNILELIHSIYFQLCQKEHQHDFTAWIILNH